MDEGSNQINGGFYSPFAFYKYLFFFFFLVQSLYNLVKQYTGMQNSIYFGKKVTRKVKDGTNHQF